MSLNQITNPASQLSIYAKTVDVPDITGFISAKPELLARFPGATPADPSNLVIKSHARKYGKQYTIFCRVTGTAVAGAPVAILFDVNIPGFAFSANQEETAHVTRRTAEPAFVGANVYGLIIEGVNVVGDPQLQLKEELPAGTQQLALAGAAAGPVDLSFTISVLEA